MCQSSYVELCQSRAKFRSCRAGKERTPEKSTGRPTTLGKERESTRRAGWPPAECTDRSPAVAGAGVLFWPAGGTCTAPGAPATSVGSQAHRNTPFSGKLAAILALRRHQSGGTLGKAGACAAGEHTGHAGMRDALEPETQIVLHVEASSPPSEQRASSGGHPLQPVSSSGSGSSVAQGTAPASGSALRRRPELSSEEQQLLQNAANSSTQAPHRAADLSAFAGVPDIPAWQKPPSRLPNATLRESFMKKRADPERTIKTITRDR